MGENAGEPGSAKARKFAVCGRQSIGLATAEREVGSGILRLGFLCSGALRHLGLLH